MEINIKKELKIEGIFYLEMKKDETEAEAINRFEALIASVGIVENNSCTSFEIYDK